MKRAHSPRTPSRNRPAAAATDAAVRPTRTFRVLAGVSARRLRGLTLLVSLSLALAVVPLAAFALVHWWAVPAVVAVLVLDVGWLRHAAVAGRVAGRARAREATAGHGRPEARHTDYFQSGSGSAPLFESESESDSDSGYEDEDDDGDEVFGTVEPAGIAQRIAPFVELDPSGWAPVPVPPPTYTLKARAADPVPVRVEAGELTGAETWSLDGLVYDCDLDDLVERRSATGA